MSHNKIKTKDIAKRITDWSMLRQAKQEYEKLVEGTEYGTVDDFIHYMDVHYGVRPIVNASGDSGRQYVSGEYEVLDEQKHLMFVLKFRQ